MSAVIIANVSFHDLNPVYILTSQMEHVNAYLTSHLAV